MRHTIGISDMKISDQSDDILVTYSLGSCIGVAVHDAAANVGGLLHFMLPQSGLDKARAEKNPYMFATTGVPELYVKHLS